MANLAREQPSARRLRRGYMDKSAAIALVLQLRNSGALP
jgi:hypothetical protein